MRTSIEIDDDLLDEAMAASDQTSASAVAEEGLRLLIRMRAQAAAVHDLKGLGWEGDLDEMRADRSASWSDEELPDASPNDLDAWWMPFTANRAAKRDPRLIASAQGMHYRTPDGRRLLDGISGLWCCNAGHGHERIAAAIREQAGRLDYAPPFQFGHEGAFALASRIAALAPGDLDHVFFCNSGSEAVDTALKIALAYRHATGEGGRTRFVGRERGYHGTGFGGISVGGLPANRKAFGLGLSGIDHLPHTYDRARQAFSVGEPEWGVHLADELERIVALHDASTINAVIVEPMAGSTGVLPPPQGYLQRLRNICDRHGILLIFDEVITGFGRLGFAFAAERYGVTPDMICFAKGVTSGTVPLGGVIVREGIHAALMQGPERAIELFHGYTYSGHPLACAAGLAALDVYRDEGLFERARRLEPLFAEAVMSLRDAPNVLDIRTVGLAAGIDLAPRPDAPGTRGYDAMVHAFKESGLVIRVSGDTLALCPALIVSEDEIGDMVEKTRAALGAAA